MKHFLLFILINLPLLLSAQFSETFESAEIPSSWVGNREQFIINNNTLLLNGKAEKETVRLSRPYQIKEGVQEWKFDLNVSMTPTNSNYIQIFPASSSSTPNGFFFRLGYTGSNRTRFGINSNVKQSNRYDKNRNAYYHVKITLKDNRYWKVYVHDINYDDSYQLLGEIDQSVTLPESAHFCIMVTHGKSNPDDFAIDNISYQINSSEGNEEPKEPDNNQQIELLTIEPLGYYIRFFFNVPIDCENASFYISGKGFGDKKKAKAAVCKDSLKKTVIADFGGKFIENEEYTVYIENLKDETGKHTLNESYIFTFALEGEPEDNYPLNSIRFNEVMANPKGLTALPETEYIELYNSLDKEVILNGFKLDYGNGQTVVYLDGISIPAKGYAVLYRSGRDINTGQGTACPLERFPSALANGGKTLKLLNSKDEVMNEYTYPEAKAACSWEYDESEWHLSTNERGGTPGEVNSAAKKEEEKPEEPKEPEDPKEPSEPDNPTQPEESFSANDVRINEVMANDNGLTALPPTEYVELYNTLDRQIDLSAWTLKYDDRDIPLTQAVIAAHGYAVLYRTGDKAPVSGNNAFALEKFPSALANTGKTLTLLDGNGNQIDQYTYPEAKAACSWEYDESGWHLSSDERGGTPGEVNSEGKKDEEKPEEPDKPDVPDTPVEPEIPADQLAGPNDIIFNELLPEPYVDGCEYIELYNRSNRSLSLKDLCISTRKSDGSLNTHYPLYNYTELLEPGDYLLLTTSIQDVKKFYPVPSSLNYLECKLPILANSGSTVVLYREETEQIIDEVCYSPKWHAPAVKEIKGVALERINPDGETQNSDNWTSAASTSGSGTPGAENSQYLKNHDTETGNEVISDPIYQPSGNYLIPYQLNQPGYSARGWIFNLSGRKVALLADNELLGTNGTLQWNGQGYNGSRLEAGVYILYIELWNAEGSVIRKKQAFLVH